MKVTAPDYILSIRPYVAGPPAEELERELGIERSVKLDANENPLGPSPRAVEAIRGALGKINRYPDAAGHALVRKLSARTGISAERIVLGNGADEIIAMLVRALLGPGDEAVIPDPSFLMYDIAIRSTGGVPVPVPLRDLTVDLEAMGSRMTKRTRLVFVCNPNNPTGTIVTAKAFAEFMRGVPPHVTVVVDEAYAEFVRDPESLDSLVWQDSGRPIATLRTFSKAYGLAGLRIGYGFMPEEIAGLVHRVRSPFNVNSLAQTAACAALDDEEFLNRTVRLVHDGMDFFYRSLDRMGFRYYPSQSNFLLIDVKKDAGSVAEALLRQGIMVRSMTSYGFPTCIRASVGLPEENVRFMEALWAEVRSQRSEVRGQRSEV